MAQLAPIRLLKQIKYAIVHHSAVNPGAKNKQEAINRAFKYDALHGSKSYALETNGKFGFKYASYHYIIARDGSITQLQDIKFIRNHCSDNWRGEQSANKYGVAILLDGHFDIERPSDAQINSAASLIKKLNQTTGNKLIIRGHNEQSAPYFPTGCPGKYMGASTNPSSKLSLIINKVNNISIVALIIIAIGILLLFFKDLFIIKEEDNGDNP